MVKGVLFSVCSSFIFGYLYFFSTLLNPLDGTVIFSFRVLITLPLVILCIATLKQAKNFINHLTRIKQNPKLLLVFVINCSILSYQMWLFLWAPNHGRAISVSLGYLLLPLAMVITGKLVYKENISKIKSLAIILAAIGVSLEVIIKKQISWESVSIFTLYPVYFSLRKSFKFSDISAFCIELILISPFCLYLVLNTDLHAAYLINQNIYQYIVYLGLISGLAFITYILASNLLPLNLLGILGYVEPILLIIVGFIIGESIDVKSYPLFICLILAIFLLIMESIFFIHRSYQRK